VGIFVLGISTTVVAGALGPRTLLFAVLAVVAMAAVVDVRSARIPNELVAALVCAVLARVVVIASQPGSMKAVVADVTMGVVVSGGLAMFVVWLVRPQAIGGGDWKLLAAVGAAFGLIDVAAAAVAGVVAVSAQLVAGAVLRRRVLPFAPALLAGAAGAAASTTWWHYAAGGWA
jgi:Flp pilus assembly protein protease CpaA